MISRTTIQLLLRPYANGFVRVGVKNTAYESLLGLIAPLIYKETIAEVKQKIHEVVVPRIFLNSHFGNLVMEFYQPSDISAMPRTHQELMLWSSKHLGIAVRSTNVYALIRAYNAYTRFHRFIDDRTQRKDLRHLQPLLAEPGLFTTNGVQLIMLDDPGTSDSPLQIRCPVFGVSVHRNKKNDMAFVSRSMKMWGPQRIPYAHYELYIHTSNRPGKGAQTEIHETILRWDYKSRSFWPEIVRQRTDEFLEQCQSRYQTLYTPQQTLGHATTFIPLSHAVEASFTLKPEGIVKDVYNHIMGVTYPISQESRIAVMLPVIDDGIVSISSAFAVKNIYLLWEDVPLASLRATVQFYDQMIEPVFSMYPGYGIQFIVQQSRDNMVVAVQLYNGLYVPVKATASEEEIQAVLATVSPSTGQARKMVTVKQFEWEINRDLATIKEGDLSDWKALIQPADMEKSCGTDPAITRQASLTEFEEIYQTFRYMVSNWITSTAAGPAVRKDIENIIFNHNLPEYERRKRLYLYLGAELMRWFYRDPSEQWEAASTSFIRKDCCVMDSAETCTGACHWKEDEGRCLLHIREKTDITEAGHVVDTAEMFVKRVIDELVRFPHRRDQLMRRGKIPKYIKQLYPIRMEDQYIIPESSMTWSNLLRLDWTKQTPEESKYYEEMSRDADEKDTARLEEPARKKWPDALEPWFEDTSLQLIVPEVVDPQRPLLSLTGALGITLEQLGLKDMDLAIQDTNLAQYIRASSRPIGFINLRTTPPTVQFYKPITDSFTDVVLMVQFPDRYGLIGTANGSPYVSVALLPPSLASEWENAIRVLIRKKLPKVAAAEPVPPPRVPLVVQQSRSNVVQLPMRRRPLPVVQTTSTVMEPVPSAAATAATSSNVVQLPMRRRPKVQPIAIVPNV